jgi:hypothetical protein
VKEDGIKKKERTIESGAIGNGPKQKRIYLLSFNLLIEREILYQFHDQFTIPKIPRLTQMAKTSQPEPSKTFSGPAEYPCFLPQISEHAARSRA